MPSNGDGANAKKGRDRVNRKSFHLVHHENRASAWLDVFKRLPDAGANQQ